MAPPISLPGLPEDFTSKLFHGDVVTKISDPSYRGKVLRGWADEDMPIDQMFPDLPPLVRGELLISHMQTGETEVVPELSLTLFERSFLKGDFVKYSLEDAESAVVVDVKTECLVEHVISGERLAGWVPWEKLRNAVKIEAKDRVVYDEWIGTVEEVFEDGLIECSNGDCYRIAEMGGLLETGRFANEVLPEPAEFIAHFGHFPPGADPSTDRVIRVSPLIVYVGWNAINQNLPISEHDKHPEPKHFWCGRDIEQLTHFEGMKHQTPPLNTTVEFRNEEDEKRYGVTPTMHMRGTYPLRVYKVVENRTKLKLRWQDGTETEEHSAGFVPYRNVDDYEAWPGEALVWRNDTGERKPAVVQAYHPRQRIADILLLDTKEKETVSVLELDTGGFGRVNYGVGLGQTVLLCEDNASPMPEVPSLGQVDPPEDGREGFRAELQRLGVQQGSAPDAFGSALPLGDTSKITWWGEVIDLHLDGTISVELYSDEVRRVELKNVIVLNEPADLMAGEFDDDFTDANGSEASWDTVDEGGEVIRVVAPRWEEDRFDDLMDVEDINGDDSQSEQDAEDVEPMVTDENSPSRKRAASDVQIPTHRPSAPVATTSANGNGNSNGDAAAAAIAMPPRLPLADDDMWPRFEMLEAAPAEHHYYSQEILPPSKAFIARLMKENKALANSLPENITVRTYEDRSDLMRVLIIGPEGTPYADAPFVFDVYLNPTKFPYAPPEVYFHSHTNGLGRCNPNLYEEGKVCLSILGTWAGDKSESWNASKSSLLQVFVSISGLVLVRSPYHCEPAFSKLEGTKEGRLNSRLYSEKAYVLSRSFVRTALERPPAGFEDQIRHVYYSRGRLASVIAHAKRLIAKGEVEADLEKDDEDEQMWNADAMGSLTMGAILTLKRTLRALEDLERRGEGAVGGSS